MSAKLAKSPNSAAKKSRVAAQISTATNPVPESVPAADSCEVEMAASIDTQALVNILLQEMQAVLRSPNRSAEAVAKRIALEVERICQKSNRIQTSGDIQSWLLTLARHRLQKCLEYYQLGSHQGRVELHSHLASMVYRHVASFSAHLNFQARYNLIEDFLQGFYIESLRAFRREHQLAADYSPRTQIELAEYMAFTEQYAKRQIGLPGRNRQRLIVLRAQGFAKGQPPETALDIEMAVESAKSEEAEAHSRSYAMQQVREQMVSEAIDPADAVLRNRVISELVEYLESQGQSDCVNYLTLKLQDLQASDIDQILGLTARQRDYLQQRFKYHVEKFARTHNWKLVHEWLGADLDQKLGMNSQQWQMFQSMLSDEQRQLLALKQRQESDQAIGTVLKCTPKQVQKRWAKLLDMAFTCRNNTPES